MNYKMKTVQKLVLSAMMIALCIVMTYVAKMIQPNGGYLRFSLTPGLVIFSSLVVGPFYGALVGAASDLIPAIIFPQGTINFLITIAYALLGFFPSFLAKISAKTHSLFKKPYFLWGLFAFLFIGLSVILFASNWPGQSFAPSNEGFLATIFRNDSIGVKIAVLAVVLLFGVGSCVTVHFLDKKFANNNISAYEITFICLVSEFLFMIIGKSLAFYVFYSFLSENPFPFFFWGSFGILMVGLPINLFIEVIVNLTLIPVFNMLSRRASNGK